MSQSYQAAAAIAAGVACKLNASGKVVICDTVGEQALGITNQEATAADQWISIATDGDVVEYAKIGAVIALNANRLLMTTADGDLITHTSGSGYYPIAELYPNTRQGATADGDDARVVVSLKSPF